MSDPSLYGVLYVSVPENLNRSDLETILATSRAHNEQADITGILVALYPASEPNRCERFIQWLEGPAPAVHELYSTISKDPRHRQVQLLWNGPRQHRLCPSWRMAARWHEHIRFGDMLEALGIELDAALPSSLSTEEVDRLIMEAATE